MARKSQSVSSKKKDPLLGTANGTSSSKRSSVVGWICHLLITSLPLWGCGLILAILVRLISTFRDGESIRNKTISGAMEDYQPYSEIVLLAVSAAMLAFVVTASRNVQIAVSMQRTKNNVASSTINYYSCFSRYLNGTVAIINIVAYCGFILLIAFRLNQEEPPYAQLMHMIGALVYFAGISIYALAHSYLLYRQGQANPQVYPRYLQWLFIGLAVAIAICSLVFGIYFTAGEMTEFEWFAIFFTAIYTGLFSILFHIDNVDDELRDFFGSCCCCCCCFGGRK